MRSKRAWWLLIAVAGILLGQIDYNRQITNAPEFRGGFMTSQTMPNGRVTVSVFDAGWLREYVYPTTEPAIKPGPCRIGTGNVLASNAVVKTPTAIYVCAPDGTGGGFRWAKLQSATNW